MQTPPTDKDSAHIGSVANRIFFAGALLIFVGARLWRLTDSCLWFDELFSVHTARHDWPELFRFAAADIIHPPLFYALLKIWIGIGGESLLWLRMLPFIFSVATVVPFYFLARELKLTPVGINLSLLLMAVSGFLIKYAQEVRMYSLLLFLSATSIWLFLRFVKRSSTRRALLALVVCNLLLTYTHYYGWLLMVAEGIVLLLSYRRKIASFLLAGAAALLAYAPWIYAVVRYREPGRGVAQNIGWITRPKLGDIGEYFVLLCKPFLFSQSTIDRFDWSLAGWLVLVLALVSVAVLYAPRSSARESRSAETMMLVLLTVPVSLAVLFSWILPYSIWGARHLIVCAVPFFILAGSAITNLRPYWAKVAIVIVLACVIGLTAAVYLIRPAPKLSWCAWDGLLKQVPPAATDATVVYSFEDLVGYHLWFATTRTAGPRLSVKVVKGLAGAPEDSAFFLPRRFNEIDYVTPAEIQGDPVWIAFRARRWDENAAPLRHLKSLGYKPETVLSATALGEQAFLVELSRQP